MAELLLLNPRKRIKKVARKKRRSAAQKAATRKMIAARRRKLGGRKRATRRRRKNPARAMQTYVTKPVRRRRRSKAVTSPRRRTYRRNPNGRGFNFNRTINTQVIPAAQAAGGALALDWTWGFVKQWIPVQWQTGNIGALTKGVGAIGLGFALDQFNVVKTQTARDMVVGSLTVQLHSFYKNLLTQFAPNIAAQLDSYVENDLSYYNPGYVASPQAEQLGYAGQGYDNGLTPMGAYETDVEGEQLNEYYDE